MGQYISCTRGVRKRQPSFQKQSVAMWMLHQVSLLSGGCVQCFLSTVLALMIRSRHKRCSTVGSDCGLWLLLSTTRVGPIVPALLSVMFCTFVLRDRSVK